MPAGFVWPYENYIRPPQADPRQQADAPPQDEITLPVIRVKKATPLTGTIVDENGNPVAGAEVRADWVQTHDVHSYFTLKSDIAQTDREGRFRLEHVHSDTEVRLTARTSERAIESAMSLHTAKPQAVALRVTKNGMVRLTGIAKGEGGQPIPHAEIRVSRALIAPTGYNYGTRQVEWNSHNSFTADDSGRFISPGTVPRWGQYSITVSAPKHVPNQSAFLSPPELG